MNFRFLVFAALALALSACETTPPISEFPSTNTCRASQYQPLIGNHIGASDFMPPPADTRIIGPNQVITMDYRQNRLNIDVNEDGIITRVWCG